MKHSLKTKLIWNGKGIKFDTIIDSNVILDAFQFDSKWHDISTEFINKIIKDKKSFVMPAHGWFEILRGHRKFVIANKVSSPIFNGLQQFPVQLIHIDQQFIEKYGQFDIPNLGDDNIKTNDFIYLSIAVKNNLTLVTRDSDILKPIKGKFPMINSPDEWLIKYNRR